MDQYIDDVEDAVTRLLDGIYIEEKRITEVEETIRERHRQVAEARRVESFLALNPDLDDEGLGTMNHWDAYFTEGEILKLEQAISKLEQEREDRTVSINALAGAVLQIAKQGISLTEKALNTTHDLGRNIGSLTLFDVIWAARNQSMHYEEGTGLTSRHTKQCFNQLVNDHGADFSLTDNPPTNHAFSVVKLLDWDSFLAFSQDMTSLFPKP